MAGKNTTLLGRWGEERAAEYLRSRGWKILGMGYRCPWGEIDVIARKREVIAFVEVKLRKDDSFAPARENVTAQKQRRLRLAAEMWLSEQEDKDLPARFDVVEVYAPQGIRTEKPVICHWEDAFA